MSAFDDVLAELAAGANGASHAQTGAWVAQVLRGRIANGELVPGTRLPEEALCRALGVSRNTLREAFTTLSAEHVLTKAQNKGVIVTRPGAADIREMYRVRRYLEPAALKWTTTSDSAELAVVVVRAQRARDAGSIPGMAEANQDFHRAIVRQAGSDRLDQLMEQVLAEMRLVFHGMAARREFHLPYIDDHVTITSLVSAGRRDAAVTLLIDYLGRAEEQLLAAVDS